MDLDADVRALVKDFGVSCVCDGTPFDAIFDSDGTTFDVGVGAVAVDPQITFWAGAVPGIKGGSRVTVNDVEYVIREVIPESDARVLVAKLKRASG